MPHGALPLPKPPEQPFSETGGLFEETPTFRSEIFERLEGLQIAHLLRDDDSNPYGGAQFGIECTNGTRVIVMACPDLSENTPAPWILRPALILDEHFIWTPKVSRAMRSGTPGAGWLQQRVEGQVIQQANLLPELSPQGGEQLLIRFVTNEAILVQARPALAPYTAHYAITWIGKKRVSVVMPGFKK